MAHRSWLVYLGVATMVASCTHPTGIAVAPKPTPPAPVVVPPPAAQDVADADSDARPLRSKVSRVTVYSDRARVTRPGDRRGHRRAGGLRVPQPAGLGR